jgi:class 3 adenylate cyclase/tetratricopeptide (TPR) repeat protein
MMMTNDLLEAHELACRLAAYVPVTLVRRLLTTGAPTPGEPHTLTAATLFVDVSGFTTMSEQLAADGARGAEELNRVLLLTFDAMVDLIHRLGGAVAHYYGDALLVYFPEAEGQAAQRALACAQLLQKLMLTRFSRVLVNRPLHKNPAFHLTIKIGVGYGRCQEIVIGDEKLGLEFVLAGTAVVEAAQAEKQAQSGQVVASQAVLQRAGYPSAAAFAVWEMPVPVPGAAPLLEVAMQDHQTCLRIARLVAPFIPPALYERLTVSGPIELAEHRPVTTLFVAFDFDLQAAPPETAAFSRALQHYYRWAAAVVARFGPHNARINRVLTGDKGNQLHIIFGAPVAPDAPEQALRCALALQQERPVFVTNQRIGLAAGKVFAAPLGATSRREYTVVGDVVNTSARLLDVCEPGATLTDAPTAERVNQWVECRPLAPVALRGKQAPVAPHLVLQERSRATHLRAYFGRGERPIIGREREVDLLLGGLDAALRGVGGAAAIFGGPGVGKTRLLAEGLRYWQAQGGRVLVGICYQHNLETPFAPWREVWSDFFSLQPAGQSPAAQAAAVAARTLELVPDAGADVGLWAEALGLPLPWEPRLAELSAEVRQKRFFQLARRCLATAAAQTHARRQPLLIVLEAIQWADQASLNLLDYLTEQIENWPLFIALTYRPRPDLQLATLQRPSCLPIVVSDLSPAAARRLLHALIGVTNLPPAVERHLGLRDRDGRDSPVNPLFLEEALRVMTELGVLQRGEERVRVDEALLESMPVPDTIHGLLLARIDRLPVAGRNLLQVASVIGRQFALEPLDTITPETPRNIVLRLLGDLTEEELTQLVTADPEWIYLFQHAMTHEVTYESLPYARRQSLHASVADWLLDHFSDNLKPVHALLAYHFSRANIHEEGLRFALEAAKEARDLFANREAVELYTLAEKHLQALGLGRFWETAVDIYLSRGDLFVKLGDLHAARHDADRALEAARSHAAAPLVAKACNLMADIVYRQGHYDAVLTLAAEVTDELAEVSPREELARAGIWKGLAATARRDYATALAALEQAEAICTQHGMQQRLAHVLEAKGFVYYGQKRLEEALNTLRRSVELSRDYSTPLDIGFALNNVGFIEYLLGQTEAALASYDEAVEIGQRTSQSLLVHVLGNRAAALAYLGRFPEALENFQEALALLETMDHEGLIVETNLFWGYEYANVLQDWEEARRRFAQAARIIDAQPDAFMEDFARLNLGRAQIELAAGALEQAEALLAEALALLQAGDLRWWQPAVFYFEGLLYQAQERPHVARRAFEKGLEAVAQVGCPDYLPLILLELARLEPDLPARRARLLRCVAAAESRARALDRIYCLEQAGRLLAELDGAQAARWLDRADALRAALALSSPSMTVTAL